LGQEARYSHCHLFWEPGSCTDHASLAGLYSLEGYREGWERQLVDARCAVLRGRNLQGPLLPSAGEGIRRCWDRSRQPGEGIRCGLGNKSRHWRGVETESTLHRGGRYYRSSSLEVPPPLHILKLSLEHSSWWNNDIQMKCPSHDLNHLGIKFEPPAG
jgi:hypothetical protein